jgi:cytochrome c-type biogenesis protein CcmE
VTSRTRRRLFLGSALAVAILALSALAFGNIGRNIVYYWGPTEVLQAGDEAHGATIRLGGQVVPGSLLWDPATQDLHFSVSDGANTIAVHASGAPPEMFREGIGVLVEGTMGNAGVFEGSRLLVKHSNEYRAPVDGKHPNDVYKSVEGL